MTHEMDIWHDSFVKIKEQTKTIEITIKIAIKTK